MDDYRRELFSVIGQIDHSAKIDLHNERNEKMNFVGGIIENKLKDIRLENSILHRNSVPNTDSRLQNTVFFLEGLLEHLQRHGHLNYVKVVAEVLDETQNIVLLADGQLEIYLPSAYCNWQHENVFNAAGEVMHGLGFKLQHEMQEHNAPVF